VSRRLVVLAAALMAFGLVLGVVVQNVGKRGSFAGRFSSWSAEPDGLRAAYLTLERAGVPVTRRTEDLADLGRTDALLLVGPSERIRTFERDALLAWVEKGHTLVFLPQRDSPLLDGVGLKFTRLAGGLGPRPITEEADDDSPAGPRRKRRLGRDGGVAGGPDGGVAGERARGAPAEPSGGPLAPAPPPGAPASQPGAPASQPSSGASEREQIAAADAAPVERLLPPQPSEQCAGVIEARAIVAGALTAARANVQLTPLLRDPQGRDVGVAVTRGRGTVVVIAAPDLVANRRLGAADNAQLLYALATAALAPVPRPAAGAAAGRAAPPTLTVDEFHHGFQGSRTAMGYLWRGNLRWVVIQLLFLGFLALLRVWRRFGPPMDPPEATQTARDYLMAMARIYRLGGHRAPAAQRVWDYARRQVATRLGLGAREREAAPVEMERIGLPELARLYQRAEHARAAVDRAGASDGDLLAFGRAVAALEAEARRGRRAARPRGRTAAAPAQPTGPQHGPENAQNGAT
jgi:hypothetical protein